MGRFYRTSKPQFIDNIIYQPPWELMNAALASKQKKYDDTLGAIELFKGQLDIKHRNSEADTMAAQEIASYYEDQAQELANQLYQSPDKVRDIQLKIGKLSRELSNDRKYGNISQIEGTYNQYQGYLSNLDEMRKKDPKSYDSTTANAGLKYFDKQWGGNTLANGIWSSEELIRRPDILDANNVVDLLKKMPAHQNATSARKTEGGYIVIEEGTEKFVSNDDLLQALNAAVGSDPTLSSYMQQQQKFGIAGANYYDSEGKAISPYQLRYFDKDGKEYTNDEVGAMTSDQREGLRQYIDPANNPLGALYGFIEPLSYQEETAKTSVTFNQALDNQIERQHEINIKNLEHLHNLERDNNNHANKLDELNKKGEISPQAYQTEILLTQDVIPFNQAEYSQRLTDYVNTTKKLNAGQEVNGAEAEKYENLNTFYQGLADELMLPLEDFMLIQQLKADPNFGITNKTTYGQFTTATGAAGTSVTREKSPERLKAEQLLKKWDATVGKGKDFNKMVMEKAAMEEVVYIPSNNTPEGRATIGLFNAALQAGDYGVYAGDEAIFDESGKIREDRRLNYELDTPWGFRGDGISDEQAGAQPFQYLTGKLGGAPMDYISGAKVNWQGDYGIVRGVLQIPAGREGEFDQSDLDDFQGKEVAFVIDRTKSAAYDEILQKSPFMKSAEGQSWYLSKTNPQYATTKNAVSMAVSQLVEVGREVKYHNTDITLKKVGQQEGMGQNGALIQINNYPYQFTEPEVRAILYGIPKENTAERKAIIDANMLEVLKRRTSSFK